MVATASAFLGANPNLDRVKLATTAWAQRTESNRHFPSSKCSLTGMGHREGRLGLVEPPSLHPGTCSETEKAYPAHCSHSPTPPPLCLW